MTNCIDLNVIKDDIFYRISFKWGKNLENKVDKLEKSYGFAKFTIESIKEMCKETGMKFEFIAFEKFEIHSKDLSKDLNF